MPPWNHTTTPDFAAWRGKLALEDFGCAGHHTPVALLTNILLS
jgi:hypothetical protein